MELLRGKTAWITGASRGIGKAIAVNFAKNGAQIIACARTLSGLEDTAKLIYEISGSKPYLIAYDIKEPEEIKTAFHEIKKLTNTLDIMVNNAGIIDDAILGMITDHQVNNTLDTNTRAVIYHTQYAARYMNKQKSGSIINISSIVGLDGNPGQVVYAASKAAVIGITLSAAKELAPANIRVNAIAPGFIDTDLTRSLPTHIYKQRLNSIKIGRVGTANDVAMTAVFLASDMSSYVTGQIIGVTGCMQI